MGEASRVYAEELQKLKYGHPLWWPAHTKGPGGREREIEIADVGYIDEDGAFKSLFNIAHNQEHELNGNATLPISTPFQLFSDSVDVKPSYLSKGPLCSFSVKSNQIKAEMTVYVASLNNKNSSSYTVLVQRRSSAQHRNRIVISLSI